MRLQEGAQAAAHQRVIIRDQEANSHERRGLPSGCHGNQQGSISTQDATSFTLDSGRAMWQGQDGLHPGARRARIDLQPPAELLRALAHGPDADATLFNVPRSSLGEPAASVADFQPYVGVGLL